ncbi:glutathione S-transferase [Rhizobium mongolense subsp. loessense]|uniref:glutathione transferase n=1 Tax=Rhizobium mongolense subsp. loessense TaxID=158890 RepID=A0A1G4Q1I6_9HYPH|nr:glutathione S-transferase family protein [Rhizobium mongolense]SCW38484.1 glutathione S-transferase [Rhizobium mongolense subsp. loessense]
MQKLTLISHHLCPYVQRAAITLGEKGAAFERVFIDLDDKPDWFLKISPLGKVPLLLIEEDGRQVVLFESAAICEYIDETQPGPRLHPQDALTRARHRGWMEFGSSILADLWMYETTSDRKVLETKRTVLASKFLIIETELSGGPLFVGKSFSLVDAVFAPIFRYFDVFDTIGDSHIFDGLEKVKRWRSTLLQRPSVRQAAATDYHERLVAFLEKHQSALLEQAAA